MTKDELIEQLKSDLSTMLDWAMAVSDEYLDGESDTRSEFVSDLKAARETLATEAVD